MAVLKVPARYKCRAEAMISPESLSAAIREAIVSGPNVLSVITHWEVRSSRLVECSYFRFRRDSSATAARAHGRGFNLPPIDQDPFDCVLIGVTPPLVKTAR